MFEIVRLLCFYYRWQCVNAALISSPLQNRVSFRRGIVLTGLMAAYKDRKRNISNALSRLMHLRIEESGREDLLSSLCINVCQARIRACL